MCNSLHTTPLVYYSDQWCHHTMLMLSDHHYVVYTLTEVTWSFSLCVCMCECHCIKPCTCTHQFICMRTLSSIVMHTFWISYNFDIFANRSRLLLKFYFIGWSHNMADSYIYCIVCFLWYLTSTWIHTKVLDKLLSRTIGPMGIPNDLA